MTWLNRVAIWIFGLLPGWLSKWIVFWLKRKYVVGVVAVLPNERGEFLFLHHTYRRKRPWRLPGGLKERDERPFDTVVREMREEANMTVRPLQVIAVSPSEITLDVAVLCQLVKAGSFLPNAEIDGLQWVDPAHAPFDIPEEQREFLEIAIKLIHWREGCQDGADS
ncbi:MAG: NUDIX hydrolase [Bacilli bacterium]